MRIQKSLFATAALFVFISLLAFDVIAQEYLQLRRCQTREEMLEGHFFHSCKLVSETSDTASVSDYTFTTHVRFRPGPDTYTLRWLGEGFFNEEVWSYAKQFGDHGIEGYENTDGGTRRFYPFETHLYIPHRFWSQGPLTVNNIGEWTYQEIQNDLPPLAQTFDVKGLALSALSGANQIGIVDQPLPYPLVLKLESFDRKGIESEILSWSISGPKGAKRASVSGMGSGTDADGVDEGIINLGSKPGDYIFSFTNRLMLTQQAFTFTAINDIEDTNPANDHPDVEEGVGQNQAQQCDTVGNPIGLSIGNKFQREVDLEASGISPIEFVRYHNSLGFVSSSFANYWTHSYDRNVEIPVNPQSDPVKVIRSDGKKVNFSWNGSAFQAFPGIRSSLEQTAGGWRYTDEDLTVENFDLDGRLVDISDVSGKTQSATHDNAGRLIRIESNTGGSLDFTYDGSARLSSVTDQAGRKWTYRYEILGRLAFVDKPDGTTREYHYEDLRHAYALTGITTEDGQRFSYYEYNEQGLATASYHAGNADRVDIEYDANGDRIVLDPLGNATLYQTRIENKRGVLEGISGPVCSQGCGQTDSQYSYDSDLNVTSKTVYGVTTLYGNYDSRGQPGYTIQAVGTPIEKRIDYEYDPDFLNKITRITEPSVYDGESRVTTRSYDFNGRLLSETVAGFDPFGQPVSRTTSNAFDGPFGQITSSDGPRSDVNDVTSYEYYPDTSSEGTNRARLKTIVDPNGIPTRSNIVYSNTGKIVSESRPNGMTVEYDYYAGNNRIKSITESGGGLFNRTQWAYYPVGDVQRIIIDDESGKEIISQFYYDDAQRLERVESRVKRTPPGQGFSEDQWLNYQYDEAGNIISETRGSSGSSQIIIDRVFDAYNHIEQVTRGGITQTYDYNPNGTLASSTDGNQGTTTYSYDALMRLTNTTQLGQFMTAMTYDTHGKKLTVTDPANHSTNDLYDDLGNRVQLDSPDTGVTTYTYDESGQLLSQTDAKGQISIFTHDATGRVISIDRAGSDYDISFVFDNCTHGSGRLCEVSTAWGHTIRYEWNAIGELSSVTSNEGQVSYTYGPQHSLTSIEYPSGRIIRYDIDGGGLPVAINLSLDGLPEFTLVDEIAYSPLGRPVSWQLANGLTTTVGMDARHRPISINVPGVWNWQAGQYDDNDNLLNLTSASDTYHYGYDVLDRLAAADSTSQTIGFTYDGVGNRLSKTTDGVVELGSYESGSNRIAAYGNRQYSLDPNGNTVSISVNQAPDTTYAYSSHNRLLAVIDETTSTTLGSYQYDGLGQRISKTTASGITKFVYGLSGELLAELDANGKVLHEYVYLNGTLIADLYEEVTDPPPSGQTEVVVDSNGSSVDIVGSNWQERSDSAALNGDFWRNKKFPGRYVRWYVDEAGFIGGHYDVYVKWMTAAGKGTLTNYRVLRLDDQLNGVWTVEPVNHAGLNKGDWVLLGNFEFKDPQPSGRYQGVYIRGNDNTSSATGSWLIADAVKLVPTSNPLDFVDFRFIHTDHLGTPHAVTDKNGQVVWSASYRPFGEATVDEDPDGDSEAYSLNVRFPGQYFDAEPGLHYNYFRDYDPSTGRYIESDPIGIRGGTNTFNYAQQNPLTMVDPRGLYWWSIFNLICEGIDFRSDQERLRWHKNVIEVFENNERAIEEAHRLRIETCYSIRDCGARVKCLDDANDEHWMGLEENLAFLIRGVQNNPFGTYDWFTCILGRSRTVP